MRPNRSTAAATAACDGGLVGDVAGDSYRAFELLGDLLRPLGRQVEHGHPSAFRGKLPGGSGSDAGAPAGDEKHLSVKSCY